jgi:hypothetical protein
MPQYEARLLKRSKSNKSLYDLADCIPFEAPDDARRMAPALQVSRFDDSDMALVFSSDHRVIWRLYT